MISSEGKLLVSFAKKAGAVLKRNFGKSFTYSSKAPGDFVTETDLEVEKLLIDAISRKYPGDAIFSEESGGAPDAKRRWIIDPLDGTANFVFGVPHIGVSMALEENGRITKGVVLNPISDELYFSDGDGVALLNGQPVKCSERANPADCLVTVGVSMTPAKVTKMLSEWKPLFEQHKKGLALLAPALNICHVACGRTDIFVDPGSEMTGHAAAAFILQNAGGRASNYDFTEWDHRTKGIVASNALVHDQLRVLKK